jgi:NADPH:quinone reductase-like Zn-dependent oxidoreductase
LRALTISAHGGLDQIEYRTDLPVPELSSGDQVRVRVRAAALNRLDLFVIGGLPNVTISAPWVLGCDAAGTIEVVGADVDWVSAGDHVIVNGGLSDRSCEYCRDGEQPLCPRFRVMGEHIPGTFAEYIVLPAVNVRRIPVGVSWDVAGAFTLATLTAWRMAVSRADVQPGEDVLIWGIGGGVALAAMQICKSRGARVWVSSGSDEKLKRARAMGADFTLNHRRDDVARVIRERTGKRGVDVVLDNVGEQTWDQSLRALGRRGRLVTCGATSGPHVQMDVRRLFWNQWSIMGSTMGSDAEMDAVTAELAAGRLIPPIDRVYDLAQGREAFGRLASAEQFGKVVLRMDGRA